jgi:hypothetical protein
MVYDLRVYRLKFCVYLLSVSHPATFIFRDLLALWCVKCNKNPSSLWRNSVVIMLSVYARTVWCFQNYVHNSTWQRFRILWRFVQLIIRRLSVCILVCDGGRCSVTRRRGRWLDISGGEEQEDEWNSTARNVQDLFCSWFVRFVICLPYLYSLSNMELIR